MTTMKTSKKNLLKKQRSRLLEVEELTSPVLRFTPYAWANLLWFRDHGDTEIGGFGVTPTFGAFGASGASGGGGDLLLIEDFVTVKQQVTSVSVEFDDEAVADFFENQVDLGRKPQQFARLWMHTHPGDSPYPSSTDEETFSRVFGKCDWAVMFVLARGGQTYARLRFNVGPKGDVVIPVRVDYSIPFEASNHDAWQQEYAANIQPVLLPFVQPSYGKPEDDKRDELTNEEVQWLRQEQELLASADVDMDFDEFMDVDLYDESEVI